MKKIILLIFILITISSQYIFSETKFFIGGTTTSFSFSSFGTHTGKYNEKITHLNANDVETNTSSTYSQSSDISFILGINLEKAIDIYLGIGNGFSNNFTHQSNKTRTTSFQYFLTNNINIRYNFSALEWLSFYVASGAGLDIYLISLMEENNNDKYVSFSSPHPLDYYLTLSGGVSFHLGANHNHRIGIGPKGKFYILERKKYSATFTTDNAITREVTFDTRSSFLMGIEFEYSYTF